MHISSSTRQKKELHYRNIISSGIFCRKSGTSQCQSSTPTLNAHLSIHTHTTLPRNPLRPFHTKSLLPNHSLSPLLHLPNPLHNLLLSLTRLPLQTPPIHQNPRNLRCAHNKQKEVDSRKRQVLGADDEAPAGPEGAGRCKSEVLGEGKGGGRAREVGDAG